MIFKLTFVDEVILIFNDSINLTKLNKRLYYIEIIYLNLYPIIVIQTIHLETNKA